MRAPRNIQVILALCAAVSAGAAIASRSVTYPIRTMGTYANITLVTADSSASEPVALLAQRRLMRVDSLMSNWTTTSEVARVNREAASSAVVLQPEVARVVETALRIGRESDGAFDITVEPLVRLWGFLGGARRVPSEAEIQKAFERVGASHVRYRSDERTLRFEQPGVRIDLGGIAKGYAVDEATAALRQVGVRNALVDLSGNMYALGSPATSPAWRIGIRDPRDRIAYFARLTLSEQAIATSGKYEQFIAQDGRTYGHIMDPRTGRPAEGIISVTVLARTAMEADAWSTALFVLGPGAARAKSKAHSELDAIFVTPGEGGVDTVWVEDALKDRFTLDDKAKELFRVAWY